MKPISGYQFAAFRIVLGIYLALHFAALVPYAPELFSRNGVLPDARLNFTHGILPNPLEHLDTPAFATGFVAALALLAVVLATGRARRESAVLLWYGSACLFNRNNLMSNPSLPYIGSLLLLTATVPLGEPMVAFKRKAADWFFPVWTFRTAWILMAVGYTYSGLDKWITSPSWQDGTALLHVVNLPLAQPGPMRELVASLPDFALAGMTYGALALEVGFLPLALFRKSRPWVWSATTAMHLGIMLLVSFADLSLGMLMVHLFTFDPEWLPARRSEGRRVVLFDGVCALCDRSMRFLVDEDEAALLHFAPLQGSTAGEVLERHPEADRSLSTVIYVRGAGTSQERIHQRSDAAFAILDDLGGFWRVVSWLRVIPRPLRDAVYQLVATHRYRWFGKLEACALPGPGQSERFLA